MMVVEVRPDGSRLELACVDRCARWRRTVALADRLWVKDELDPGKEKPRISR
jgi:hypothetical protein